MTLVAAGRCGQTEDSLSDDLPLLDANRRFRQSHKALAIFSVYSVQLATLPYPCLLLEV